MKKFAFLVLFPTGNFASGNQVLADHECITQTEARAHFQNEYPLLPLDSNGYAKVGEKTYCIAEYYH